VRRQNPRDGGLELGQHFGADVLLFDAAHGCRRLAKAAALVHGRRPDNAVVGHRVHTLPFTWG